ncbi:RNA-directed DNA polymerase, eukaryota, reverse transcriptase zinc-binding domain protein [Tanacetum coccineum]
MVRKFELDGFIPRGCNSSFITLVPKIQDPLHISDFRPISLIGCQYKVIAKILANRLQGVVYSVVSEVQAAYIKDRQIIDGPLMVNEVISWASKKKERLFLLKVDFEKAFDSLDWKFLDNIMNQMGFSSKWRMWINGCLKSTYGSVIVNGSPTKEFKIQKGLRQGDPLSPFLFIIAVEALHIALEEAKSKHIFEGVKVGSNKVDISHLQFADDALILENEICALGTYYFSLFFAPKCVILYLEKLRRNFFWGGSLESNKMAWIAWDKTCSSPSCGGLGIGSLHASNLAMLVKWWWRFLTENNSFWKLIITSIHGPDGGVSGFDSLGSSSSSMPLSPWNKIMNLNKHLVCADINLQSIFSRKVGNGASFSFWNDAWLGEQCLKNTFPRLYALEQSKECKVVDRCNMLYRSKSRSWDWRRDLRDGHEKDQLDGLLYLLRDFDPSDVENSWACSLNSNNTYTVSSMRKMIEVVVLWNRISRWWGMVNYLKTLLDLSSWADSTSLNNRVKLGFDVVLQTAFWVLWRSRDLVPNWIEWTVDPISSYVTGNSENAAVLQSTFDRCGRSVLRGINQEPDRNNTASRADDNRRHQDIQSGRIVLRVEPEYPDYNRQLYKDDHFMENTRAKRAGSNDCLQYECVRSID